MCENDYSEPSGKRKKLKEKNCLHKAYSISPNNEKMQNSYASIFKKYSLKNLQR